MNICIPKPIADKMKEAFASGELSIETLYDMNPDVRHAAFRKYLPEELTTFLNGKFDEAKISTKQTALKDWLELLSPEVKNRVGKTILDKINDLDKLGVLDSNGEFGFLRDVVATKLGMGVTEAEVKNISELAGKMNALSETIDPVSKLIDTPYWAARRGLENYVQGLTPTHKLKVWTSLSGRGAMLLSFKSPLLNVVSNTAVGMLQAFERRIAQRTYRGLNGDFGKAYAKKVNEIYQASGYDVSRLTPDAEWAGPLRLGERVASAQGVGGVTGKVGKFYEDIVFKQLMGAPDTAFSAVAFADSADLMSTRTAQLEGLTGEAAKRRALEIFQEAVGVNPTSNEAILVRAQGVSDARIATFTNKSGYSDVAMAIRNLLDKYTGDVQLGTQWMPFVKTPANVVGLAVDAAGVGAFKGFLKLPDAIKAMKAGDTSLMRLAARDFTRAGLGLTLAAALAYMIDPDDFVGDYDILTPRERELAQLKNAPYNSIRLGGTWVSLDYLGPLAAPLIGIMYARKYGDGLGKVSQYLKGSMSQLARYPGIVDLSDMIRTTLSTMATGDFEKAGQRGFDELVAFASSRVIPGITSDIARGLDRYERETEGAIAKVAAKIPGLRAGLPERIEKTTGEPVKTGGFLPTLLFGSRVKKATDDVVIAEINRLYGVDAGPTIADIDRSPRVAKLKQDLGLISFNEALKYYGRTYGANATREITSPDYQIVHDKYGIVYKATDEDKMKKLNSIRSDAVEDMILEFTKNKTTEQLRTIEKQRASEVLAPYFGADDYVWGMHDAQLRVTAKQIAELESGNTQNRKDARKWLQQYPEILYIRRQIALLKKQMLNDPNIREAYEIYRGR